VIDGVTAFWWAVSVLVVGMVIGSIMTYLLNLNNPHIYTHQELKDAEEVAYKRGYREATAGATNTVKTLLEEEVELKRSP
jgi:membrane protein YqaA with SNARE-associated domain